MSVVVIDLAGLGVGFGVGVGVGVGEGVGPVHSGVLMVSGQRAVQDGEAVGWSGVTAATAVGAGESAGRVVQIVEAAASDTARATAARAAGMANRRLIDGTILAAPSAPGKMTNEASPMRRNHQPHPGQSSPQE
jgi:hypothetical protein